MMSKCQKKRGDGDSRHGDGGYPVISVELFPRVRSVETLPARSSFTLEYSLLLLIGILCL